MISQLYKIDNEVVFYRPDLNNKRTELYNKLINGEAVAYDLNGNIMSVSDSTACLSVICDRLIGTSNVDKIYANIEFANVMIACVRAELLQYPQGEAMMSKLSSVVSMLQVGMFYTASQVLLTIPTDDIITSARLTKWSSMLISSDAITRT